MTTAYKQLAKLTPKTSATEFVEGGISEAPPHIIAAACAKLPRKYWLAGRARYLLDETVHADLTVEALIWTLDTAKRESWPKHRLPILLALSRLAILELYEPRAYMSPRARYTYLDVHKSRWYRVWAKRYAVIHDEVHKWSDICALHVHHELRKG